ILPRKSDDEDVLPTVLVEVDRPGEEIVRVLVLLAEKSLEPWAVPPCRRPELQLERGGCRVVLVPLLEVGPLPPPGPRDDVVDTVVVQVAKVGSLAPKLVAQLSAREGVKLLRPCQGGSQGCH